MYSLPLITFTMRVPVRPSVMELAEYKPGKLLKGAIKLSSNENPLGSCPLAMHMVREALDSGELNLSIYPWERNEQALRAAIAEYLAVDAAQIVIGAGIDGVLDTLVKIFLGYGDDAIIPIPTFSLYESLVRIASATPRFVPRNPARDFAIPREVIEDACNERTRMIFLASPNNPTGNCATEEKVRAIAESVPKAMVVLDEAYVEFADRSLVQLVQEYENVLILRTFSKAFGLAGLRVGYAVVPEWVVGAYKKVSLPFTVNNVALIAAHAALQDREHVRRSIELVKAGRAYLIAQLGARFTVHPSQANFVLLNVAPRTSASVCAALEQQRITVRDCSSFRGAGESLIRISVGTPEQNERVVEALRRL